MAAVDIREVWGENLESEFEMIKKIVEEYPYIAMDTEFPGKVLKRLTGNFKSATELHYQELKDNVDLLQLIQLGLTFSDDDGNLATVSGRPSVWQFNFREFDADRHIYAADSIDLLRRSGIDFRRNNAEGIDAFRFGELLMSSGIVLNDAVRWVTFDSGFDFGYLLKLLTRRDLPATQIGFFSLIDAFFPTLYDLKHMMKFANGMYGSLNKLAERVGVERVGVSHQAGSDSLVTSRAFHKLRDKYFAGDVDKYAGVMFGLGLDA